MRNRWVVWLFIVCSVCAGAATAARQAANGGEEFVGVWAGTWDGSGSGNFELTLEKGKEGGGVTGKVAVTTEAGDYKADFKSVSFEGKKMTAKYDFPLDAAAEVVITATFDANTAKGRWSLRPKGQDTEVIGGPFTVTKK